MLISTGVLLFYYAILVIGVQATKIQRQDAVREEKLERYLSMYLFNAPPVPLIRASFVGTRSRVLRGLVLLHL